MSKQGNKANNDNHANQLNKNNAEYGNSRNHQDNPAAENTKENSVSKENNGEGKINLKPSQT